MFKKRTLFLEKKVLLVPIFLFIWWQEAFFHQRGQLVRSTMKIPKYEYSIYKGWTGYLAFYRKSGRMSDLTCRMKTVFVNIFFGFGGGIFFTILRLGPLIT